jgi:hypothetical protein
LVRRCPEPFAEAIVVEQDVVSRAPRPVTPQIEVEQRGELRRRRRRDELAARIESAGQNELMQRLRREVRNNASQEWRIQQSRESMFDVRDFGHGPAMIPVLASNKQS